MGRVYLPALVNRRNAGYGVASFGELSPAEGVCEGVWEGVWEVDCGITRLGALADEVLTDEATPEWVLSLLRERFDEEGDAGTASGAEDMAGSDSVFRPVLILTLRRSARSLSSLNGLLLRASVEAATIGTEGTRAFEGGMVEICSAPQGT